MASMGEHAYAYAKACGIIGKSFVGTRMRLLEKAGNLSELDRIVFPDSSQSLPEKELLFDLEKRLGERAIKSILSILRSFTKPPEFLVLLVRGYEYADLKNALVAAFEKEKSAPPFTDIGRYQTVRFKEWPDIRKMLEGTEFDFLLSKGNIIDKGKGSITLQSLLDKRYYNSLWKSLFLLPRRDRHITEKILSDEISLNNSCWALRLRTYYNMRPDEVKGHLVEIKAEEALASLEYPLDSFEPWANWHWRRFLNPETGGRFWNANPRHFQNAASQYLYRLAKNRFHSAPGELSTTFCFIKIKQFEEDLLTSIAEGLGMGMNSADVFQLLEVTA